MLSTYVKTSKNKRLDFSKFKDMAISEDLVKSANICYHELETDGLQYIVSSNIDADLLFAFLIYFFEQKEEYEKCAYLQKLYEVFILNSHTNEANIKVNNDEKGNT